MRVKVKIDVDRGLFLHECLEYARYDIRQIRERFVWHRKSIFYQERFIPKKQEVAFATLYEKVGIDTVAVRKFQALRAKYLADIRAVWVEYWSAINHNEYTHSWFLAAEKRHLEVVELFWLTREADALIKKYKSTARCWPESLDEIFFHIMHGDMFSLAIELKNKTGSRFAFRSKKSWFALELKKVKTGRCNMKN